MLNIIDKLEKSKTFWMLLGILLLFFLLRLPSLIEPNWYGDEGIYQVLGQAMHSGRMLYSEAWDNKPPLLYVVYALFDGDQFSVRTASLIVGLGTVLSFFFLARRLLKNDQVSLLITFFFILLFATPFIEGNIANAENFILLPVITAGLLVYHFASQQSKRITHSSIVLAGILLGTAFLFKIVALFDFAAFFSFLVFIAIKKQQPRISSWFSLLRTSSFLLLSFLFPVALTALYFIFTNTFSAFIQGSLFGNIGYVGYGNQFIIPQGLLILKACLLGIFLLVLFIKRNKLSLPTLFILIWFGFSLFSTLFSQRPYTHYLLLMIPSVCLLIGLVFVTKQIWAKILLGVLVFSGVALLIHIFHLSGFKKTIAYYPNAYLFATGQKDMQSYQAFFDGKTPRDYAVASFLKLHTNKNESAFIWGDNAQIYSLSHTLPPNKYTVAYHIRGNNQAIQETQRALADVKPKYVIILAEAPAFPFSLDGYLKTFSLERATVYERSF